MIQKVKTKMAVINIKSMIYNKPDELLCIQTDKKITLLEKNIFDYILYNAKKMIIKENIKEIDNFLKIKNLSLEELFIILGLTKSKNNKIAYLLEKFNNLKNVTIVKVNLIKNEEIIIDESFSNIKDNNLKSTKLNALIGGIEIDNKKEKASVYLSPIVAKYILKGTSFTQTNLLINFLFKSNYSKNLYAYLLNKFQSQVALMSKGVMPKKEIITTEKIDIEKLMDILEVPYEHIARKEIKWFNVKILNKAIKEINENKAVEFEIVDIKKERVGRKIRKIWFLLKERENRFFVYLNKEKKAVEMIDYEEYEKLKNETSTEINENETATKEIYINKNPLEELKEKIKTGLPFITFVKELQKLKNVEITNVFPNHMGKMLKINEFGMLEFDGEELKADKANFIRKVLYKRYDELLGKIQEDIDIELENIKGFVLNKYSIIKNPQDNLFYILKIKDVKRLNENRFIITGDDVLSEKKDLSFDFNKKVLIPEKFISFMESSKIDHYREMNIIEEERQLEKFYEENKAEFKKWLKEKEDENFLKAEKILTLEEGSEEYEKLAKEISFLDTIINKGHQLLTGVLESHIDRIQILKRFKKEKEEKN